MNHLYISESTWLLGNKYRVYEADVGVTLAFHSPNESHNSNLASFEEEWL